MSRDIGAALADICEEASALILPLWRTGLTVFSKADESPVTEADRRGETLILERLSAQFPDIPVISEEDASEFGTPDAIGPRFFLVDPVDGTKAFVRGDPNFTVNIGLIENGRPVAGAVTAPASDETWFTQGGQAMKRRVGQAAQPISVRPWPQGAAVALISHTMSEETAQRLADQYGFDLREPMDSSIKFCRIAEGAADIYPRHGPTMEWDVAAGHAVLLAAGGQVATPEGEAFAYGKADAGFRNGWFVARGG
ncbi:MAG: 3'(2'),5'-bisphosphate nucleotidase CysQ [Pseudomonadota bacterium]|uniref:3'(2'),5'-bisphosphate nucleotidase CysQ n=1 Tax=unclassified Phenylobacterium TaxID=2640670 RepID=UPI0006FE371E|nr:MULTISPECIES: 3'(2'),5'-bisphosphate nucleotidase CysQ [unclassified Phenylobacterium]KRB52309.1 3'(2'),5'-bisphosphate nucleotidase CysQ [Phenylobacterium sp. Root700]MBT9471470.1 3'(2'),5'-bisphosphate nucleotidase CysQ [Phenylobacterium sp.]